MPIQLASLIVPKNSNTWYLMEDIYLKGGLQVVANSAARDALNPLNRKAGMIVITQDDKKIWQLGDDLVTWNDVLANSRFYDILGGCLGKPGSGASISHCILPRPVIFPVGLTDSLFSAGSTGTADTTFSIYKNDTLLGSITFLAGAKLGTAIFTNQVPFSAGDILKIVAPVIQDATLADISLSIVSSLA